jgi:hypothetical protein
MIRSRPSVSPMPGILLAAVCILIAAAGKVPYAFYGYMRSIVLIACLYGVWYSAQIRKSTAMWILVAVGVLLNPIAEIKMHRSQWQPIDLLAAIALFVAAALIRQGNNAAGDASLGGG